MIPQGYKMVIETQTNEPRRYFVIGWKDYGVTLRPIVALVGDPNQVITALPPETQWMVVG